MLDKAAIREAFIVAAIASGGFREGTFAKLKYRHVKEDLEAGQSTHPYPRRSPHNQRQISRLRYLHKHRSMPAPKTIHPRQTTRRKINAARRTNRRIPTNPKQPITDRVLGVSEKTIRKIVHDLAVSAKISKKLPNSWMYSVRTHSLRKFFRSQLSTAKIDTEIVEYMMGHTINTYEDVQSLGVETLRNLYASAGLAIRPKTQINRIEQLKEIIRAWGENPEEILSKDALLRGNITETQDQTQNHQLSILAEQLKQIIRKEATE